MTLPGARLHTKLFDGQSKVYVYILTRVFSDSDSSASKHARRKSDELEARETYSTRDPWWIVVLYATVLTVSNLQTDTGRLNGKNLLSCSRERNGVKRAQGFLNVRSIIFG